MNSKTDVFADSKSFIDLPLLANVFNYFNSSSSVLQYDLATPEGFSRSPPLFVHSNLLKHLGGAGLSKGNLFKFIRRMSEDYSSSPLLNHAHSFVYGANVRGMCLDLDWHEDTPQEVKEDVSVETYAVEQEEGGVFDGFEDAWWEEGGRVGGW